MSLGRVERALRAEPLRGASPRTSAALVVALGLLPGCTGAATGRNPRGRSDDSAPGADDSAPADDSDSPSPDDTAVTTGNPGTVPACVAYGPSAQLGTVVDTELNEISGIAVSRRNPGVLWVQEDHAGANAVYAIDEAGNSLGQVVLDGIENNDWEDLAIGTCDEGTCVYVGEIGDNDYERTFHAVYRFPEPEVALTGGLDLTLTPDTFAYAYPDGAFLDAEALVVRPDGVPVVFTKSFETATSTAFAFPELDATATVTLVEGPTFSTGGTDDTWAGATTSADLWPDASHLLLRTYGHVYDFSVGGDLDTLAEAPRHDLHTGAERQGEAIAFDTAARGYWTVSEGVSPALWFTGCGDPTAH